MRKSLSVKELCVIAMFTALTAVLAQIAIPLPFTPIPFSCGMVAVYITSMLLKPSNAVIAQLCYLAIGAAGIPVFGNFRGGIAALLGPTGGCLMVYPLMAAIISITLNSKKALAAEQKHPKWRLYLKTSIALTFALITVYLGGALWLSLTTGNTIYSALTLVCIPFIPLDIVKIIFCVMSILPFRKLLMSMNVLILDKPVVNES